MLQGIREAIVEVVQAVLPIILIIVVLEIVVLRATPPDLLLFLLGSVMVVLGIALFLSGVKAGLLPIGEAIGSEFSVRGSLALIIAGTFLFGFLTTVAEPNIRVLGEMLDTVTGGGIPSGPLTLVIAVSVGFIVTAGVLRIIFGVPLAYLYAVSYAAVIVLAPFTSPDFLAVAVDAGGITTGLLTIPIILALGTGITSVLAGRSALTDGFGLVGLASLGPILGVMLMGMVYS
ncbi:DUF1538 domain-containing protein [Methanoculleus sp. DTU007]|jgi:hypothetical protein|uniref:DUF1538 domain-containing protein n=1 Tax=Methanoculleus sp. DTU007 TaxID=1671626 RepID=UPI000AF92B77|nr:DUF1538 domain-containing protein [Methanoculleus sp. DTU007]NLN08881.1 DUF1538 domain-containing protein [Methanoculleus thermophilus]